MSLDRVNHMLSKFNFSFSWKYAAGDSELRSTLPQLFRVLDDDDERSLEQILIGCVYQESTGLILSQPNDCEDAEYEMNFIVHPLHESFCITKIVLLSEARNLELYVNGGYEKSTRGIRLTLNSERKSSLFEAQFALSSYVNTKSKATIKFLSHPCKDHMQLQAVVLQVAQCNPILSLRDQEPCGPVNLSNVRHYLGSVGKPLSNGAEKMLQTIENYQKSPAYKAQQMVSSHAALLQNFAQNRETEGLISRPEEKVISEEQRQECCEDEQPFMSMLTHFSEFGINDKLRPRDYETKADIISSQQARRAAYLQSRLRASKTTPARASRDIPRSISLDGYPEENREMRDKEATQRPLSDGCVCNGGVDQSFDPEQLRLTWVDEEAKAAVENTHIQRCDRCGCPGCISVFTSISTNILEAEKRILEKNDEKFAQLQKEIDAKFQVIYQLLERKQVLNAEDD